MFPQTPDRLIGYLKLQAPRTFTAGASVSLANAMDCLAIIAGYSPCTSKILVATSRVHRKHTLDCQSYDAAGQNCGLGRWNSA
jgi:hypothetical protein